MMPKQSSTMVVSERQSCRRFRSSSLMVVRRYIMMMVVTLQLLFVVRVLQPVEGTCYCPIVCENCYRMDDFKAEYGRAPCNDIESKNECEQANWELLNKRDTTVTLVEKVLYDKLDKGNVTGLQVGFVRSLLALAVEDNRPEGDCSNGLSTDTAIAGTLTHCFSPELLQQCAKVRDGTDQNLDGIANHFEELFYSIDHYHWHSSSTKKETTDRSDESTNSNNKEVSTYWQASQDIGLVEPGTKILTPHFQELIELVRMYTNAKTARVRCASFEATTLEISGAVAAGGGGTIAVNGIPIIMMIIMTLVLLIGYDGSSSSLL